MTEVIYMRNDYSQYLGEECSIKRFIKGLVIQNMSSRESQIKKQVWCVYLWGAFNKYIFKKIAQRMVVSDIVY